MQSNCWQDSEYANNKFRKIYNNSHNSKHINRFKIQSSFAFCFVSYLRQDVTSKVNSTKLAHAICSKNFNLLNQYCRTDVFFYFKLRTHIFTGVAVLNTRVYCLKYPQVHLFITLNCYETVAYVLIMNWTRQELLWLPNNWNSFYHKTVP